MADTSKTVYILRPYLNVDGGTPLGTCTITTDWTENTVTNLYTQNVALSTVTAASNPMIKCMASADSSEYNRLIAATAYNGGITFTATKPTSRDLTVEIINWTDKLILTNMFVNDFSLGTELDTLAQDIAANTTAINSIKKTINTTCILGTTWTLDSTTGYYAQKVEISGIDENDQPSLSLVKNGTTPDSDKALETQWALVSKADTYDGGIIFYATSPTISNLTIRINNGVASADGTATNGTGTNDYAQLTNKPRINGTVLEGDVSITSVSDDAANIATNKTNISTNTTNIAKKQDALVSGTNIKTVNGNNLLGSGNITTSQIYTCTLGTSWTLNSTNGYYTQTVTLSSITSSDTPILDVDMTKVVTLEAMQTVQTEWAKVVKATTGSGTITFYASEATTISFTVQVKVV